MSSSSGSTTCLRSTPSPRAKSTPSPSWPPMRWSTAPTARRARSSRLLDYSDGSDMIIGKPGINSIKDLKGKKVGLEVTLVEHLLLLKALEANGMKQSRCRTREHATNETPQTLALRQGRRGRRVVSGLRPGAEAGRRLQAALHQRRSQRPDLRRARGEPDQSTRSTRTTGRRSCRSTTSAWITSWIPKTHDDAVKIMAAKVGADAGGIREDDVPAPISSRSPKPEGRVQKGRRASIRSTARMAVGQQVQPRQQGL